MAMNSAERLATLEVRSPSNADGEREQCGDVEVVHRFVEAPGAVIPLRWHYVEAGASDGRPVLLVHGHPFSWYAWAPVIERLAAQARVVAVDLKGYGQSDKRPGDWRMDRVAEELLAFADALGLASFVLGASDRGAVVCDYLAAAHRGRIEAYVRVGGPSADAPEADAEFETWHREPLWARDTLADAPRYFAAAIRPRFRRLPGDEQWMRFVSEFAHPQTAEAVPRYYQSSSFEKERDDREHLFASFSFPTFVVVGAAAEPEKGQPAGTITTVEASPNYPLIEAPGAVAQALAHALETPRGTAAAAADRARPQYVPAPQLRTGWCPRVNLDGEIETLGAVSVTHRFGFARGALTDVRWHWVTAGDPRNEALLFLHGHPESWHSWRQQIERFADRFFIVAPDLKGYGQSDKRPGDFRHENVAEELLALLDGIGLERFSIVAHDRGAVQGDYLGGNHPERIVRYVRMQQVGHVFIPMNSPQEKLFRDPVAGPRLLRDPQAVIARQWSRFEMRALPEWKMERLRSEIGHDGIGEAIVRYFQSSSFQKELYDRTVCLWRNMSFPVLLLQADRDVGQPPWYYDDPERPVTALFPDARVQWVRQAGHFTTINEPEQLTEAIEAFIAATTDAPKAARASA